MEYALGNIYVREGYLPNVGSMVETHQHNFDHVTYIASGSALVEQLEPIEFTDDGIPKMFKTIRSVTKVATEGHNYVLILAGKWHRITALEEHTKYQCIYAHRNPQGDVVQEYDGWRPGNV